MHWYYLYGYLGQVFEFVLLLELMIKLRNHTWVTQYKERRVSMLSTSYWKACLTFNAISDLRLINLISYRYLFMIVVKPHTKKNGNGEDYLQLYNINNLAFHSSYQKLHFQTKWTCWLPVKLTSSIIVI